MGKLNKENKYCKSCMNLISDEDIELYTAAMCELAGCWKIPDTCSYCLSIASYVDKKIENAFIVANGSQLKEYKQGKLLSFKFQFSLKPTFEASLAKWSANNTYAYPKWYDVMNKIKKEEAAGYFGNAVFSDGPTVDFTEVILHVEYTVHAPSAMVALDAASAFHDNTINYLNKMFYGMSFKKMKSKPVAVPQTIDELEQYVDHSMAAGYPTGGYFGKSPGPIFIDDGQPSSSYLEKFFGPVKPKETVTVKEVPGEPGVLEVKVEKI